MNRYQKQRQNTWRIGVILLLSGCLLGIMVMHYRTTAKGGGPSINHFVDKPEELTRRCYFLRVAVVRSHAEDGFVDLQTVQQEVVCPEITTFTQRIIQ